MLIISNESQAGKSLKRKKKFLQFTGLELWSGDPPANSHQGQKVQSSEKMEQTQELHFSLYRPHLAHYMFKVVTVE